MVSANSTLPQNLVHFKSEAKKFGKRNGLGSRAAHEAYAEHVGFDSYYAAICWYKKEQLDGPDDSLSHSGSPVALNPEPAHKDSKSSRRSLSKGGVSVGMTPGLSNVGDLGRASLGLDSLGVMGRASLGLDSLGAMGRASLGLDSLGGVSHISETLNALGRTVGLGKVGGVDSITETLNALVGGPFGLGKVGGVDSIKETLSTMEVGLHQTKFVNHFTKGFGIDALMKNFDSVEFARSLMPRGLCFDLIESARRAAEQMQEEFEPARRAAEEIQKLLEPARRATEEIQKAMEPTRRAAEEIQKAVEPVRRAAEQIQRDIEPAFRAMELLHKATKSRRLLTEADDEADDEV